MARRIQCIVALLGCLVVLGGCSVKAPPRQAWSLSGGSRQSLALSPDGPALGVARFTAAAEARFSTPSFT